MNEMISYVHEHNVEKFWLQKVKKILANAMFSRPLGSPS